MQRLVQFDISSQFLTVRGQRVAQYAFGTVSAGAMIGLRSGFDLVAPTSGPFALIYPTVLLATLYGHWRAGLAAYLITFLWAWYYILPAPSSWNFIDPTDPARVALNALCCAIIIVFAEAFRRAARSTFQEIQKAADRRLTLLAELEHRTKNNFALVASMLELQKRRSLDPHLKKAIDDAAGRVRAFADAYSNLSNEEVEGNEVAVKPYLNVLLDRVQSAAFPPNINLYREIEPAMLPRESAAAIGLYLNEALTNSLKYAFPEGKPGTIGVFFHANEGEWSLTIDDDGIGLSSPVGSPGGIGSNLMDAFAQQCGAYHQKGAIIGGFRATLTSNKIAIQSAAAAE